MSESTTSSSVIHGLWNAAKSAGRPLEKKKAAKPAEEKKLRNINNPFINQSKPPVKNKNGELQYYMYIYNGKPVYHDPDTFNWNLPASNVLLHKETETFEHEIGPRKVDPGNIKLKYMDFSEVFKFNPVNYHIHTDNKVQQKLENLGVDTGDCIILEHHPYENGTFRFANYEHAKECFRKVLEEICYEHPKVSADLMKFYLEALKRFNGKNLTINMKGIVPEGTWVDINDGTKNGSSELVNSRSKSIARYFYLYFTRAFQDLLTKQGYAKKIKVFPELYSNKPFKEWKDERNKRDFFRFCKPRLTGKNGENFRRSILSEKEQFRIFWAEIDKGELKLESSLFDSVAVAGRDSNVLWVKNPAESRKKINGHIIKWGPVVDCKGANQAEINKFYQRCKQGESGKDCVVIEVQMSPSEPKYLAVVKNDPEIIKEIDKYTKEYQKRTDFQYYWSDKFYEKLDISGEGFKEADNIASPIILKIAEDENVLKAFYEHTPMKNVKDIQKVIYYFLRFWFVFLKLWAVILALDYFPPSWPYFVTYVMPRIYKILTDLVIATVTGDENSFIDGLATILSLASAGKLTAVAIKGVAKLTKGKVKTTALGATEKWTVENIKKYLMKPGKDLTARAAKYGINMTKMTGKYVLAHLKSGAGNLIKRIGKLAAGAKLAKGAAKIRKPVGGSSAKMKPRGIGAGSAAEAVESQATRQAAAETAESQTARQAEKIASRKALTAAEKTAGKTVAKAIFKRALAVVGPITTAYSIYDTLSGKDFPVGAEEGFNNEVTLSDANIPLPTDKEINEAIALYAQVNGHFTSKDRRILQSYPYGQVYIKFAKDERIQNMPPRKVKAMINLTIDCINKKYFTASKFTVDDTIKAFNDLEKINGLFRK